MTNPTAPSSNISKPGRQRDWAAYDSSLKARGRFDLYLDDGLLARWNEGRRGKMGCPRRYSDVAILAVVTVKFAFNLANRQTEGLVESLLEALGRTDLVVPDHTSISRRMRGLDVELATARTRVSFARAATRRLGDTTQSVVIDSTGLAVSGPHAGRSDKWGSGCGDRRYRKVHVSTDPRTGEITAVEVKTKTVRARVTAPSCWGSWTSTRPVAAGRPKRSSPTGPTTPANSRWRAKRGASN